MGQVLLLISNVLHYNEPSPSIPHSFIHSLTHSLHGADSFLFPAFYGPRKFIAAFTSARHLSLSQYQYSPRLSEWTFRNEICFYGEELLALRPTPKLEGHPVSAVRDCLFNIFAATPHFGGRSSIRNLRRRHAVVTGTHSSRLLLPYRHIVS